MVYKCNFYLEKAEEEARRIYFILSEKFYYWKLRVVELRSFEEITLKDYFKLEDVFYGEPPVKLNNGRIEASLFSKYPNVSP